MPLTVVLLRALTMNIRLVRPHVASFQGFTRFYDGTGLMTVTKGRDGV